MKQNEKETKIKRVRNRKMVEFPAAAEEKVKAHLDDNPHPIDIHVGARLRSMRTLMGVTQEQLGRSVGLTFQQIQKYEKGFNRISCSRLWEFAILLGTTPSWFFEQDKKAKQLLDDEIFEAAEGQEAFETEKVTTKRETLELVRVWYNIKDTTTRKKMLSLLRSMTDDN